MAFAFRNLLPERLRIPLFGDRKRWGKIADRSDPNWIEWERLNTEIYLETQQQGMGAVINNAGYRVLKGVDLTGKKILEIGPGRIAHLRQWRGIPLEYVIADRRSAMLDEATAVLQPLGCKVTQVLLDDRTGHELPLETGYFDIVVSFYSLEHLHPLDEYLREITRVLAPGGRLVGAIPTEGGIAWGFGRFLTTRRYFKRNTSIDPDKIICWEHPNFADDVIRSLGSHFRDTRFSFWPLAIPAMDLNLFVRFICRKGGTRHDAKSSTTL